MSIITYPLNGITYDADDVQTYLCTRTSGVYSDENCFDISITDDMEVTIGTGIAWIKNGDFAGKSICMDESAALTISVGAGSYSRIDRIVIKFDASSNESTLEVLEGTPSTSPSGTDIEQDEEMYELCLYEISVPAGTTELTASMITDTRIDEDLCGLMRDGVTAIPTATLQAAAEELIQKLQSDIDSIEAGSAYMLSSVYDEKGGAKQVAFEDDIGDLIDEYLPFSLAISEDGDYGYYDTDDNFVAFRNPTGDAAVSDVLSGKVFSNADEDDLTGTMTNNGTVTKTLDCGESYTIVQGYHSGSGTVTANSLSSQTSGTATAAYILSGYTAWVSGSELTGTMTNKSGTSTSATPSTSSSNLRLKVPTTGYYNTSAYLYATYSTVASTIGLTADIITSGNTVLGISGTASTSLTRVSIATGIYEDGTYSVTSYSGYSSFASKNFALHVTSLYARSLYTAYSSPDGTVEYTISSTPSLTYNSSTGVVTISGLEDETTYYYSNLGVYVRGKCTLYLYYV